MEVVIEFWNGHRSEKKRYSKHDQHVTTKHNPCLWTNIGSETKPWRASYTQAVEVIQGWSTGALSDEVFLHDLRFVAYGLGKRPYDDREVVWPGNLTESHTPKLSVNLHGECFTIHFAHNGTTWVARKVPGASFYWPLHDE